MKVTEFWVIYHHDSGKTLRKNPENYYTRMTPIGPAFGGTFETTPRFPSLMAVAEVSRFFSALVMNETQHVAVVAPEDRTFPTCGLVQHYANLAIEASFNRAAKEEVLREAQEKEDGERAEVREPEPGQGVQLDPRGQEPEEVEEASGAGGEAGGSDRPEVQHEEAVPGAEGGSAGGVIAPPWELKVEPYDKSAFCQPSMGMGCFVNNEIWDGVTATVREPEQPQTIEDVRFYVDSMTRVDGGEHTQDPDSEWDRVDGRQVCDQCGKTYQNHPLDGPEGYDGKFLNRLCDGRLVKL